MESKHQQNQKLQFSSTQLLNEFERDWWEERAAILEYDAGFTRQKAEYLAQQELLALRGQNRLHKAS